MDLEEIRKNIDSVDKEIIALYEKRMELSKQVAEYKIGTGKPVKDAAREASKLKAAEDLASNDFNKKGVRELFTQIMSASRKLQYSLIAKNVDDNFGFKETYCIPKDKKVVYQGEEGAYAHEATLKYFGNDVLCYNAPTWRDAMEDIKNGKADYAVLPIENSTAGIVNTVYDLLVEYDNYIVDEVSVPVSHKLVGIKGTKLSDIKKVISHPQALMQCERFLSSHNDWTTEAFSNTAAAALKVSKDNDKSVAALSSAVAAKLYGLEILADNIVGSDLNTTRFVIVGKDKVYCKDADKISLCFELPHEAGSLYNALSHCIYNGINMTKIESRPIPERKWEYRFFINIEGKFMDASVKNALIGLEGDATTLKIMGTYHSQD